MNFQLKGKVIFFATDNIHKFDEARKVLVEYKIAVGMLRAKALEIQSDDLEEIAKTSVLDAFKRCNLPLIVEDAGLFIDALNGFPGPYAAYVYRTIGNKGLLKLMENIENRKATFHSVIAYYSAELKSPIYFKGEVAGEIAKEERRGKRESGFGFDPIFKPAESNETFAEMTIMKKNKYSHRAQALRKFAEWHHKSP
ncbi:MAG: XTP/dITP diphosphatase [Candidatus Bathyarchaeota archaeon]|nr:XTP/dITP diphosphatase [Candidatus Bathyarchaeota archaeon]